MTKETWIELRLQTNFPIEIWFEYYREMGGKLDTIQEFEKTFNEVLSNQPLFVIRGRPIRVTVDSAMNRILNYYDNKFGL